MNSMPLPDLHQADLDADTLNQLFADIGQLTQVIEVLPKYRQRDYTPDTPISLDEARDLLRDGTVYGLQIRYIHNDAQWWDTLMPVPNGMRLVRIRHDL